MTEPDVDSAFELARIKSCFSDSVVQWDFQKPTKYHMTGDWIVELWVVACSVVRLASGLQLPALYSVLAQIVRKWFQAHDVLGMTGRGTV